jgi:D-aspartate ligase
MVQPAKISTHPVTPLRVADTSTPVLVVSLTTHGPLGIIRSLGRLGVPVYALHSSDCQAAQYSRYLRRVWRWNFPNSSEGSLETLAEIGRLIGRRAILLPTSDETAVFVAENQVMLRAWFDFPAQPSTLPRTLSDKKQMYHLVKLHGVPTPETLFPQGRDEVLRFAADIHFPVVLKAIDGARAARRTGQKMVIVRDIGELLKYYDELEDPSEPDFMLQEYIPGGDDTIWMFNGYFNEGSVCLYGATGQKIRQHPVGHGPTSLGICLQKDAVDQTTRNLMNKLGYRGILDIGYRWDARDGQFKVLDINPRIGCTFRLFTAENGLDVARALYLDLTGQSVPVSKVREGRKWMVEVQDFKSCLEYRRKRQLTVTQWLRSLRGVQETAFFAVDDMRPFRQVISEHLFRRVKKLLPRRSLRVAATGELEKAA